MVCHGVGCVGAVEEVPGPRTRSRSMTVEVTAGAEMESADDKEFTVTEEMNAGEGSDDEETMELEEKEEGTVDHGRELAHLKQEGEYESHWAFDVSRT